LPVTTVFAFEKRRRTLLVRTTGVGAGFGVAAGPGVFWEGVGTADAVLEGSGVGRIVGTAVFVPRLDVDAATAALAPGVGAFDPGVDAPFATCAATKIAATTIADLPANERRLQNSRKPPPPAGIRESPGTPSGAGTVVLALPFAGNCCV
jgi:hypothetical protein